MTLRSAVLLVVLLFAGLFVVLNWIAIMAPTTLSLAVATINAPLGLIMLGLLLLVSAAFLVFILYLQTGVLLETRRQIRDTRASRELADQAEASRFTELRSYLASELVMLAQRDAEARAELHKRIEETGNSLAAAIGELEDRIERNGLPAQRTP
ncbi:MAG: Signal transduction histidine kinase [Candidatus Dactylopiibacterium carminicum]|uniref:Signal transduction histidine kinase n=1 Tax=Candidatus Dactylopiibacterium carminicum TaxID=857335 RepID=A0A272EVI6_9RHOO|nr:Signal transduction histidine kinase [Candidatus Dactylopiibacterium carminicum]KAF7600104.1 Signal transduction histidine kinase [Candidatus Dactylopiibacterium carminicum]PAS94066.1 MAG: Signal transduction histidine kinase [Candidatus Dactylopiibacterium carminicum]PAS98171.1 MAG: Signal transduction histidine kinase [Candidatus Dactylopiibacterium carminicum]PAT00105.1 MAG: hypothetical protein BSR46_04240 [Candidatus Dactylopiibacterium carminicum]